MPVRRTLLWPGGRYQAFTLSYDDGIEQDIPFIALLKKYRLQATFNLNPGVFGVKGEGGYDGMKFHHNKIPREQIQETYEGFEIANHTLTHPWLEQLPSGAIAYEVAECRKQLEDLCGRPVTGCAYPFGTYNDTVLRVLAECGVTYCRTVVSTRSFDIPKNFLLWHATCHHDDPELFSLADRFLAAKRQPGAPLLFYVWGHSYEFDAREHWGMIEEFFQKISGRDEVWYATNGEICDYVRAADQLVFTADGSVVQNPTAQPIWLDIAGKPACVEPGGLLRVRG